MTSHKDMTQRYALFFDIDGTLVSFKTHEIPPSTIFALTQAKANGSRVYIATGRPPIIITNLGAIEHLIDGYITTNGALCFVGNELVSCQPIAKEDVLTCVEDSQTKGYSLIVVGRKDVAVLDPTGDVDCVIALTPSRQQNFEVHMDASTNSAGLIGITPSFTYNHFTIFHGGEVLSIGFRGNFHF